MENPSLQIGGGDWAVKETKLLGTNPVLNRKIPVEIDVTNATIGTRVNKQGFIENGPRNLLTFSEDLSDSSWSKSGVTTTNGFISPEGTKTAIKITNNFLSFQSFFKDYNSSEILTHSRSIWARSVVGSGTVSLLSHNSNSNNTFTLTEEWKRYEITGYNSTGSRSFYAVDFRGGTLNEVLLWHPQAEQGPIVTEYYPTTTRTNLARIDYSSGEAALLIEPQRTNLVTYSNDPSQTTWTNSSATLNGETTIAPDGSIVKGYDLTGYLQNIYGSTSGLNYVNSIWVKANQTGLIGLRSPASSNVNLEITTSWRRISLSGLTSDTNGKILLDNRATSLPNLKVFVWGAQAEQGAFITSTIPTLASAVTRNADVVSKSNIYTNGFITDSGGTLFVELNNNVPLLRDVGSYGITLTNTLNLFNGDAFEIRNANSTLNKRLTISKRINSGYIALYETLTDIVKISIKWNGITSDVFVNGVKVVSSTAFTVTKMEYLRATGEDSFKCIKSMSLFPAPLSDAECIELTTL
jgi:hypothetical protein